MATTDWATDEWSTSSDDVTTATYYHKPQIEDHGVLYIPPYVFMNMRLIANVILSPIISVFGIAGNTLCIYILHSDPNNKQQSVFVYLIALMAFDMTFLILSLLFSLTNMMVFISPEDGMKLFFYMKPAFSYLVTLTKHMTTIVLIVLSFERWMSLSFPFKVKQTCVAKFPCTVVVVSLLVSTVYLTPFLTNNGGSSEMYVIEGNDVTGINKTELNETAYEIFASEEIVSILFDLILYVETIILHVANPLLIVLLSAMTAISFKRFLNRRAVTMKRSKGDNDTNITVVVLVVNALYIILTQPVVVIQILLLGYPEYGPSGKYATTFYFFFDLSHFFNNIFASIDIFAYILISKRYRDSFLAILFGRPPWTEPITSTERITGN